MGYVQQTPAVAEKLTELGVSAGVWDEVLEEMRDSLSDYGQGFLSRTPPALDELLFDLRPRFMGPDEDPGDRKSKRQFDYTRGAGQTDRGYVAGLLKQVDDIRVERKEADIAYIAAYTAATGRRVVNEGEDEDAAFFEQLGGSVSIHAN